MKAWVEDAIEQIAAAEILNSAGISVGERLALIVCDNAVEYMMIAYTEVEKHLVYVKIKPREWANKKGNFKQLLDFTAGEEPKLGTLKDEIFSFHKLRNDLYHTGLPKSVKAAVVSKYLKISKSVVEVLFNEKLTEDDWSKKTSTLNQAILGRTGKAIKTPVKIEVHNDVVQVELSAALGNCEILCVILDAFVTRMGSAPTVDQLTRSLALSHASHLSGGNLSKRIYDCRQRKLILKHALSLTPKGQKLVARKAVTVAA